MKATMKTSLTAIGYWPTVKKERKNALAYSTLEPFYKFDGEKSSGYIICHHANQKDPILCEPVCFNESETKYAENILFSKSEVFQKIKHYLKIFPLVGFYFQAQNGCTYELLHWENSDGNIREQKHIILWDFEYKPNKEKYGEGNLFIKKLRSE